ncbi:hypothetical protein P153DRAFT_289958, partial [Dothidotthia symphoricarpi CBS 119687]
RADLDKTWDELEWAQLQRLRDAVPAIRDDGEQSQPPQWARCNGEEYASRNRYLNVDPYQANRVRMDVPEGCSDYINASPMLLTLTKSQTALTYIATQGPKADSWSHLWRMIWNLNLDPAVIVMLTQTHEAGREKCYQYYPPSPSSPHMDINEHDEFGDGFQHSLELTSMDMDEEARTIVSDLDLVQAEGEETRKVCHLLFAGWPDFLVPEGADKAALLKLIDMSREKAVDCSTNPRIVHCSAGIGRSGTFIALDWLLQELDEGSMDETPDDEDPIVRVIQVLRDQRPMMVQSKNQFFFIYDVVREQWLDRWNELHPDLAILADSAADSEPALKRQKSMQDDDQASEARARLEAELQDAQFTFENGTA